jgi:hypothetical protein
MRRRTFLATLPAAAAAPAFASAQSGGGGVTEATGVKPQDIHAGDRVSGANFASRSTVWGVNGAAATAHPLATLAALDTLRKGGTAIDAAIAANACLGFLEPVSNGMGGDVFVMLWDPKAKRVVGLNGSGRSPRALTLDIQRKRAVDGHIWKYGTAAVSVPGAVDGWWTLHQRYGRLPWKDLFQPAIGLADAAIGKIGLTPPNWLGSESFAMVSLAITTIWWTIGFNFVLYLAGLQEIPRELYEASAIDGAGPWQQIRSITIPMLSRTTTLVAVLQVIASLKVFDQMYIMTQGGPNFATRSVLEFIYDQGFTNFRIGYASALSMLFFVVVLIVSIGWFAIVRRQEKEL